MTIKFLIKKQKAAGLWHLFIKLLLTRKKNKQK